MLRRLLGFLEVLICDIICREVYCKLKPELLMEKSEAVVNKETATPKRSEYDRHSGRVFGSKRLLCDWLVFL